MRVRLIRPTMIKSTNESQLPIDKLLSITLMIDESKSFEKSRRAGIIMIVYNLKQRGNLILHKK